MLPCTLGSQQGSYPEVSQLQGDLHKGVRAGPALLDEAFAKGEELEAVQLHVVCQRPGHLVGALNDRLALWRQGQCQGLCWGGLRALDTFRGREALPCAPWTPGSHFTASPTTTWPQTSINPMASLDLRSSCHSPHERGLARREEAAEHPSTCPCPSRPTHPLRNVPLQPLRRWQHEVRLAQAVPCLCVAQVEDVSAQSKLQREAQAERLSSSPTLSPRTPAGPLSGPVIPPRGAL